jgi:hypothetical protein
MWPARSEGSPIPIYGGSMLDTRYDPQRTGLLLVDPYNDFLSEGGGKPSATLCCG